MRGFLLALILAVIAQEKNDVVIVEVGGIVDTRARDISSSFTETGLCVDLKLTVPSAFKVMMGRVTVDVANDDNGKKLHTNRNSLTHDFGPLYVRSLLSPSAGDGEYRPASYGLKIVFSNPDRSAKMIKELRGKVELLKISNAATDIISVPLNDFARNPKENAAAKAFGMTVEFGMSGENALCYEMEDRNSKIAFIQFCDAIGTELLSRRNIVRVTGMGGGKNADGNVALKIKTEVRFTRPLPAGALMKIYLATDSSVVTVPFAFKDIVLP